MKKRAFTLIELLIVVVILLLLTSMIFPQIKLTKAQVQKFNLKKMVLLDKPNIKNTFYYCSKKENSNEIECFYKDISNNKIEKAPVFIDELPVIYMHTMDSWILKKYNEKENGFVLFFEKRYKTEEKLFSYKNKIYFIQKDQIEPVIFDNIQKAEKYFKNKKEDINDTL